MAPKILSPLRDVKIKAGMPINLEIDFEGEPNPEVLWYKDDQSVPERILVEVKEGKTSLFLPAIKREDSGVYKLKLTNDSGQDSGSFTIAVQGDFNNI